MTYPRFLQMLATNLLKIRDADARTEGITEINLALNSLFTEIDACEVDASVGADSLIQVISSCPPEKKVRYYPNSGNYVELAQELRVLFLKILNEISRETPAEARSSRAIASAYANYLAENLAGLQANLLAPERLNLLSADASGSEADKILWSRKLYSAVLASLVISEIRENEFPEGGADDTYFPTYNTRYLTDDELSEEVFGELPTDLTPEQALIFNAFLEEMQGAQTGGASEWFQLILEINALASYFRAKSADLSVRCGDSGQIVDFHPNYRRLLERTSEVFSKIRGSARRSFEAQDLDPSKMDAAAKKLFEAEEASLLERATLEASAGAAAGSSATAAGYALVAQLGGMSALLGFVMSIPPALLFGYMAFEAVELEGFTKSLRALRESWGKLTLTYRDPCNPAAQRELKSLTNDLAERCKYAESKRTCHLKYIGISVGGAALLYFIGKPLVDKLR